MIRLPIDDILDDVKNTLVKENRLILQAPPGAGKSTRVPLALLDAPWLEKKMILMLEPRRVAARMVATQMAKLLGEALGESVGYSVKMHSAYSKNTKILVVTEAILVRMLHADEMLSNVGVIIFDEFHERNIHSDLSLALSLQVQELIREDLKLLIMSATLNTQNISTLLGGVSVLSSDAKSYDVEKVYLNATTPQPNRHTLQNELLKSLHYSLKSDEGDILVFLAGVKEIHSLQRALKERHKEIDVFALHARLTKEEQDRALLPSKRRKVILATNIAQTSLTIEGVRVVIDSGYEKISRFNYATAMNHLEYAFVSKDAATQRAGRAGRLSHGKCYRLWHEHKPLQESTKSEILRLDLSALLLDLALWGVVAFDELLWLDVPNAKVIHETRVVLQELEMLDENFKITHFGRDALSLGVHPRFAYMILKATEMGYAYEACLLAALLSERDILKNASNESDLSLRFMQLYERDLNANYVYVQSAKEVLKVANIYHKRVKQLKVFEQKNDFKINLLSPLLLLAYPDRLAKRRGKNDNRYILSNLKGALLNYEDTFFNEEYLVVAHLSAHAKDSYIHLALKITLSEIEEYFSTFLSTKEEMSYNKETKKFDLRQSNYFLNLKLSSKPLTLNARVNMKEIVISLLKKEGLELLNWSKKSRALQERVNFVNAHRPNTFESFDEEALQESLHSWLEPSLHNIQSVKELESLDVYALLLARLSWSEQQHLEELAPSTFTVPSGSKIFIEYTQAQRPFLRVKIQEMFNLEQTPRLLEGSVALQIHLLSPAMRPIQITDDLANFWKNSYEEVRKELRGKYKRHYWPENPYEAIATKKTKKQMKN